MPLNVPDNLPAIDILKNENVFVMSESRAIVQDIRPMRIVVLNLMPLKIATETHLLRVLSNNPLQVEITLMQTATHTPKNTPREHLESFYKTFDEIKNEYYDGLIITGAPIELLEFEEVDYWDEMKEIMDWADKKTTSTLYICWGAQAGLYHHYNIQKHRLKDKMFGIFEHQVHFRENPIVRGFDDVFLAPHSRHTEIRLEDVEKVEGLDIIASSDEAGIFLLASKDGKRIFVTGHAEYDPFTLRDEYHRDLEKGMDIKVPKNYFPNDDPAKEPVIRWKSHANLLFSNWLNYCVYQVTPFNIK